MEQVQVLPVDPQDLKVLLFGEKGTLLAICWQESKLLASLLPTCAFREVPVDLQFLFGNFQESSENLAVSLQDRWLLNSHLALTGGRSTRIAEINQVLLLLCEVGLLL